MENSFKRFLSLALAIVMVLSNVPVQAFATEDVTCTDEAHTVSITGASCTTDGSYTITCPTCGGSTQTLPATGHSYAEGKCATCGAEDPDYVAPHAHSWGEIVVITPATCEAEGAGTQTCSAEGCDEVTRNVTIDALGHSYAEGKCSTCGAADPNYENPVNAASEEEDATDTVINTAAELQAALTAGGKVVLGGDITGTENVSFNVPADVTVELDLNGFTITGKGNNLGSTTLYNAGKLTVKGSGAFATDKSWGNFIAINNAGTLVIDADATFYARNDSVMTGDTGSTTINKGTFNAAIEAYGAATVTINGGTFNQVRTENIAVITGGTFNDGGGFSVKSITGGTFNWNVDTQYLADGYKLVNNDDGTYTVKAVNYIAEATVDGVATKFETLQEAVDTVADGGTVKVLASGEGAGVVIDKKSVTIDFNDCTYTLTEPVGSTGTESNGFQILQKTDEDGNITNNVVLKNGTLNVAEENKDDFYILVQNYTNLTVEDMVLDGTNLDKWIEQYGDSYVLSNNSGTVVVKGDTDITANNDGDKAFAFDSYKSDDYAAPKVTIETTGKIDGKIESNEGATIVIKSGIYTVDPSDWTVEGYTGKLSSTGIYEIVKEEAAISGTFNGGMVNVEDETKTFITAEISNLNATTSVVLKLYDANNTLLATTTLKNSEYFVRESLSVKFCILGASSSWETTWETDKLRADYVPAYATLYVDGTEMNSADIRMITTGTETPINWADVPGVNPTPAAYVAKIGDTKYTSLQEAIDKAVDGDTITLLADLDIDTETYTIADGVSITLDMNGKKIIVTDNATKNYELFYIYGGLTVTGNGTIELTSTNNREWNAMSAIFHNRGGVLTIENGTFKNLGGTDMAWVVDNSGNYYGDATTNIQGGTLDSTYTAIRNRMEQNSHGASGKAILNISGGTITGTTSAVWAQAASTSLTSPATGEINVSGGNVGLINTARSAGAVSMTTISGGTVAGFKGEVGELKVTNSASLTGDIVILSAAGEEVDYIITDEGLYVKLFAVVIGETGYDTLQAAVDVVQNGETITLNKDITEDVTLTEAVDLYYTIDGNGKTMNGTITVKALSDTNDNRRITIQNINFVDTNDTQSVKFIQSVETNHYPRITVSGCSFTGSGYEDDLDEDVAITLKSASGVLIENCFGTGLHSFLQNTSGWNLTVDNVTVTNSNGGLALGTVQGVTVKNSNITAAGYGIRIDANTYNNNAVIDSNIVNAFIPVVVRKVNTTSNIEFTGTNTMTATNTDGYWCVIGTAEYEKNGELPTVTSGKVIVALNDTSLNISGVYGFYAVAQIGEDKYPTLQAAVAVGGEITLLDNVTEEISIPDNANVVLDLNGKTLNGCFKPFKGNLTVKNGSIVNTNGDYSAIEINAGELLLTDVNVTSTRHAVRIDGTVTATIDGGEYSVNATSGTRHAVNVSGAANVTIKSGTFVGPKGTTMDSGAAVNVQTGATVKIEGGSFSKGKNNTLSVSGTLTISGGTFDQDPSAYVVEGYAALPTLDGQYVVGTKPTATVNNLGEMTIEAGEYYIYDGSLTTGTEDMPLNFVMQFVADQNAEDMQTSPFAKWYADFVITFEGIEGDSFDPTGCYLAGYYGSTESWDGMWVKIPVDSLLNSIEEGTRYPVMMGVGMAQKYEYICSGVQAFSCAMYIPDEILEANPNMKVNLELNVVDSSDGNKALEALQTGNYIYKASETSYAVTDFAEFAASVTNAEGEVRPYLTFEKAYAAAQAGDTITLLDDVTLTEKLTVGKAVTIDGNGHSIIADANAVWYTVTGKLNIKNYKTHLISVNANDVTLKNITLDCNGNAAGINIYCAQNVVFDNVSIIKATKGVAALTVNGSTLTVKNAFTALGNSIALDISNGSGVTSDLGMTVESGTVFNLGDKVVKFDSAAVTDMTGAVDANGNSYFAASDNAYYYTETQINSRATGFNNGLKLLADVTLSQDITIKGTLDLNGYTLTMANGKALKITDTLTVTFAEGTTPNLNVVSQTTGNVVTYTDSAENGIVTRTYKSFAPVAKIGDTYFESVAEALTAAENNATIELISGENVISMAGSVVGGKTVTITGTAIVDWTKGNLFVGRGGEGDGKVIFDGANITSSVKKNPASTGIHVSGSTTSNTVNNGTLVIKNSNIELDYLINRNETTVESNSTLTIYGGIYTHGRNADESASRNDETATLTIGTGSTVDVVNENGMGVGGESYGIMTVQGSYTANVLNIKAGSVVKVDGGIVNITGDITNNGTIYVTGTSDIAATVTGAGWVYMNGVTLDADTKLLGAKVGFINGTNNIVGSTIEDGWFSVGIGQNAAADTAAAFAAANGVTLGNVTVNVSGDAIVGNGSDAAYSGWIGSAYSADKTQYEYTLNVENSLATFGYLHISKDGELNVKGHATNKYTYDNANVDFYAGDFIINGVATMDGTDVWVRTTKMSVDHADAVLNIVGGTKYETSRHNGATTGDALKFWNAGTVNIAAGTTVEIDNETILVEGAELNIGGNVTAKGTVTGNGTITLTDKDATFTAAEGLTVGTNVEDYKVTYADGAHKLIAKVYVAQIGEKKYESLAEAVKEVGEGQTIQLMENAVISEDTIKLPATLKNVTFKGAEGAVLKDMTIMASDGNSIDYQGLTFDGITFENSRISITGWRTGDVTVKDLTVTNCTFKNLDDTTNSAPVHINMDTDEAVENFTFTNNLIDGATGGSKSGVYAQTTGKTTFTGNTINNVAFRPYVIQITSDDGIADEFIVTGNTFSGSAAGRAQGLANNDEGTDTVKLVVSENIFKGITNAQQICYWNFNPETTTADLSKNYYDIDIQANPNKIYFQSAAKNADDLIEMGVYPYYADEAMTELVTAPAIMVEYADGTYKYFDEMTAAVPNSNKNTMDGATITLLGNYTGAGVRFFDDVTLDLNGYTYTVTKSAGSKGTETSGFQIRPESNGVTIKNGTIAVAAQTEGSVVWLLNCYTATTLTDVTLDCQNLAYSAYGNSCRAMVAHDGDSKLDGTTKIANFNADIAVAVSDNRNYDGGVTMTITSTEIGNAKIELSGEDVSLTAAEGLNVVTEDGYVVQYNNGVYTIVEVVATIGDVKYTSLAEAIAAAEPNDTVTLLKDVVLDDTLTIEKSITLDGNGHKLTPADSSKTYNSAIMVGNSGWGDDHGETITLKNLTLDGWTSNYGVIRVQGVTFEMDGVTINDSKAANASYGVLTLTFADSTVKNSVFTGNEGAKVIDINSNGDNSTADIVIDSCTFQGNQCTGAGVIVNSQSNTTTVKNSTFDSNIVTTTGNAATLYMGFGTGGAVTDNTFENNSVTTSHATTKRFASAIFCDGCIVNGNVFGEGNTATRNGETISTIVAVGAYYGEADIGENYWGGNAPVPGVDYTVEYTNCNVAIDDYYADAEKTELISVGNVAKVGKYYYTSLSEALKVAGTTSGSTVTLVDDVTITEAWDCRNNGAKITADNVTIDGNGKTLKLTGSVTDNNWNTVFRFEGDNATVKNLTIDASAATDIQRGISSKLSITVDNCKLIGNGTSAKYGVIFGEGANSAIGTVTANVTKSEFVNWSKGVSDNANGQDAKSVTVTGNTFTNASAYVSAAETVIFTGNTISNGKVNITSYATETNLNVTATGNTLTNDATGIVSNAVSYDNIQPEFTIVSAATVISDTQTKYFNSVAEAFTAAQSGDEVQINKAGTYALSTSGKDITITGAVDGVVFDNIGAKNMGSANVTFNNVTFDYYPNVNYTGLQHSGNLVYNNCTINGQVFLYGESETFNNCTFNQNSADAYNVWTYGAKEVAFNECTFNSAGKSVLIYSEDKNLFNDVTVTDCDFIASTPVEGKAAIEMDSSLTAGINLTINGETTATGFGNGNVSGNSLWNNKKGNEGVNNDITVTVNNEVVLQPIKTASIGTVNYTTLEAAVAAAKDGETVKLLTDVELSEALVLDKAITLDGGSNKLTSTAARAINVSANGEVTIKNLTIECGAATERAVNVITNPAKVTLDNVTVPYAKYAVNVASSAGAAEVTINNSNINGYAALNLTADGAKATVNNSQLSSKGVDGESNSFATIDVQANNVTVDVMGGKISATGTQQFIAGVNEGYTGVKFTLDAELETEYAIVGALISGNTIIVRAAYADAVNAEGYAAVALDNGMVSVAEAVAKVGDVNYATLADAVAAADGKTVTVLADIALTEGLTIPTGKTVTLDLNGKTISYTSAVAGEDMITNKGNLTITDSTADQIGKITYVNTDSTGSNVTVSTISTEPGSTLVIEAGTVENKTVKADGSYIYPYAIDILTNGSLGDVTVTVKGGTVYSDYMAIRQFNNGEACKNTLNVSGGYIYGAKRAIQVHMKNNAAYTNITAGKVKGGDYALCFLTTSENLSVTGGEFIGAVWYSGTDTFISGGTYTVAPADEYLEDGYEFQYASGIFTVVPTIIASVNGKDYATLEAAVEAAKNGGTIYLKRNATLKKTVTIPEGAKFTLNMMGYTLNGSILAPDAEITVLDGSIANTDSNVSALEINAGTLTLTNVNITSERHGLRIDGAVTATINGGRFSGGQISGTRHAVNISGTATVTITDGIFVGPKNTTADSGSAVCVQKDATVIIEGGSFSGGKNSTLGISGTATITGGTFDQDPSTYVAKTHKAVSVDGMYTVVEKTPVAQIGEEIYESLAAAIAAANAGDTVKLLADVDVSVTIEKAIALDTNGYTLTGTVKLADTGATVVAPEDQDVTTAITDYKVVFVDGVHSVVAKAYVAQVGENKYETLAEAISNAAAGNTITLLADVTEDVTVGKSLTIDGGNFNYTGKISVSGNSSAVTVKNVNFVDGTYYAITTDRIQSITVENCTVTNYTWGFLYANKSTPTVVVKNVTVDGGSYGMHWAYGTKATLENVKMTNVTYGIMTQNNGAKTITIKNSEISATNPIYVWKKGTATDTFVFEGTDNTITGLTATPALAAFKLVEGATLTAPEGLTVTTDVDNSEVIYEDGKYIVVEYIREAKIGETQYRFLADAIEAAKNGDTITLLQDIELEKAEIGTLDDKYATYYKVEGKTITIDLAGKTISGEYTNADTMLVAVFSTDNYGHLTLTGNGTVNVTAGNDNTKLNSDVYSLIANYEPYCTITIENGTYTLDKAHDSLIYSGADEGITINGGTFTLGNVGDGTNGKPWIFNTLGGNEGNVIVNGGTFNADINHQFWANEVYVPETKALQKNEADGTWTVVDAVAYVPELATSTGSTIRNVGYATLAEAITAAQGAKATLLKTVNEDLDIDDAVVIDLNGFTNKGTFTLTNEAATLTAGEGLTVETNVADALVAYENGTYKVVTVVAKNVDTNETYNTVEEALTAAKSGETVQLLNDAVAESAVVMVPAGVTLDLNGKCLTAANMIAFGSVIDNGETSGGLVISNDTTQAMVSLQKTNPYLPIYDTQTGSYKFFKYSVVNLGAKATAGNTDMIKLGVRITFDDPEAYKVLYYTDNSCFKLVFEIEWGTDAPLRYTFDPELVKRFASQAYSQASNGADVTKAITVELKGLSALGEATISFAANLSSQTQVEMTSDPISYTVG